MRNLGHDKVIIVEGASDRKKIKKILKDPIDIICTNGTIGITKLEELVDSLYDKEVYILVDADPPGEKLRKQFKRELPNAKHLYIDKVYKEVESAPDFHLATILLKGNIDIHIEYLDRG